MKVSEYLFNWLEKKEQTQIFGVIGTVAIWIFKALEENHNISAIFCNHEQAAVMAADGWGRVSKKPGIVITTNGPGVTNAISGIAQAWTDSSPLLYICGNSKCEVLNYEKKHEMRQYGAQDVPADELLMPITKGYFLVKDADEFPQILERAYRLTYSGRPGPVCIDIPLDIQNAEIKAAIDICDVDEVNTEGSEEQIKEAVTYILNTINNSCRPLVVAGQGIRSSDTVEEFNDLISALKIPVVTSRMGNDVICTDNNYFIGRPGQYGNRAAHFAIQTCDLLIVLGSRLSLNTTGYSPEKFAPKAKKVVIDIDKHELEKKEITFEKTFQCDLKDIIPVMLSECRKYCCNEKKRDYWLSVCRKWQEKYPIMLNDYIKAEPLNTYNVIKSISSLVKENSVILSDTGTCCNIVSQVWEVKTNQRLMLSGGLSCMGYWATGVGAAIANSNDTICIVGDGSLQMNIQELGTISRNKVPLKLFVINNNGYQIIKIGQENYGMNGHIAISPETGLGFVNLQKAADAYGIPYINIKSRDELYPKILEVINYKAPVICEIEVDESQITLPKLKSKANPDGTFVSPDYADIYPFLPEDELQKELLCAINGEDKNV